MGSYDTISEASTRIDYVADWVWGISEDETIPPFCVELILREGGHYWLHSIAAKNEESKTLGLRIWDLRALTEHDLEDLKAKLNTLSDRSELRSEIHPKLDYGNLRIHLDDVWCCVEWHDRLWPDEGRPEVGFLRARA